MSYSSEVLADSPKGYWKLDEASGSSFADSATSGLGTATLTGTLAQYGMASDSGGSAVRFDTSTAYITAGASSTMPTVATIEAWVYVTSLPGFASGWAIYTCAATYGSTTNDKNLRLNDDGSLTWYCYTGSATALRTAASVITINAWHHVVASIGAAGMKVYVDGTQVATNGATSSASYTGFGFIHGAGGFPDFNSSATGPMQVSDVAFYDTQLSGTRVSAHYAARAGATTTGTVTATASAPTVTVAGTVTTVGTVTASASAPTVLVSGSVAGITTGTVQATASAPTVRVYDSATPGTEIAVGVTVEAGALLVTTVVVLPESEIPVGAGLDAGTLVVIVPLEMTSIPIGLSLVGRPVADVVADPRTPGVEQWRYVVTDLQGVPLGELVEIEHDPVEDGVNEMAGMSFTIGMDDPDRALIKPIERQCQVWQGDALRLRGPFDAGNASDDGTTMTYRVSDPSWWWRGGRALIGRTPALNLLKNGDFDQGLTYWTRGHDADSIPASDPTVNVRADTFTGPNGHAAEIVGVETVTQTSSELSSNAVFWPNLATFRPGGVASIEAVANAMPTTAGLKVLVVGHTANDGTGSGLDLSKRRADAAAAIIHGKRPAAVITTKGVGFYDPKPGYPIDSQAQRRVVISYESTTTISAKSKQWIRQTVTVTQPKAAAYPLILAAGAWLKVTDDWSVADANMVSIKVVARRQSAPSKPWDDQKGVGEVSISDTDPVDRWMKDTAEVTIPADGRPYLVDVYLYAPAALARYTRVMLQPQEILYFWGKDQALIVKGIVEHMQLPLTKMGNVWPITIGTRTPLTGVLRDKSYPYSERMPVETALDGLMSLYNGLDIDVPPHPTDTIVTTFHPKQGQVVDYVLAQGGNVVRAVPATTNDVGSLVIAQAQDSSAVRDEAYAIDPKAFGGMISHRLITAEQDTPISELDETATAELKWSKVSTPSYWLDIHPDFIGEVLAETAKGDTARLILDFPTAVDALARIVKRQIHPTGLRLMVALEEA